MKLLPSTADAIASAAEILREGGVVVIPTETVYGLAANALNEKAVEEVFRIKGRPADNPLIVHVSSLEMAHHLVSSWPAVASVLAGRFWPGPLTFVLPKSDEVPDVTTADLDSVAIRMPSHPVARAVIEQAGVPLAAPSANTFMGLSPTRVEHLSAEMRAGADLILDGGPTEIGIESTVVDLTGTTQILRPGGVSQAHLEEALGTHIPLAREVSRRSPGQYRRHYSPKTPVHLVNTAGRAPGLVFSAPATDQQIQMPVNPQEYASALYDALFRLDTLGLRAISVERPPQSGDWAAVWDRLRKAAASE